MIMIAKKAVSWPAFFTNTTVKRNTNKEWQKAHITQLFSPADPLFAQQRNGLKREVF